MRLFVCLLLLSSAAQAGRRPWIYAEDTTMIPDGDVEIENWVAYLDTKTYGGSGWHWWIGPYWAPTDGLEVAALTVVEQPEDGAYPARLWFEHLSLRWRVVERRFGALFLKLEGRISFNDNTPYQVQPSIAWAKHVGRFGFAASFGYAAGFEGAKPNDQYHWLVYRAAASFDVVKGEIAPPFQLGVELYSQEVLAGLNDLTGNHQSMVLLGPTLAVAKGRLWLTVGGLAGLTAAGPKVLIRGIIGLSL